MKDKIIELALEVCSEVCPERKELFKEKLEAKLENFNSERGKQQKDGMIEKASKGNHVSRAPFGYNLSNGKLIPEQHFREVEEIFEEFLQEKMSLTRLSKKHSLSINGLKKILRNFTYLGKVKFNGEFHDGNHKPIVSSILFNKVQDKLERLGIKKS